jgi:hypothetical protein
MAAKKRSRVIVYGNDLYREIITPNAKGAITLTYWDFRSRITVFCLLHERLILHDRQQFR